jgi:hypothetical protein
MIYLMILEKTKRQQTQNQPVERNNKDQGWDQNQTNYAKNQWNKNLFLWKD